MKFGMRVQKISSKLHKGPAGIALPHATEVMHIEF